MGGNGEEYSGDGWKSIKRTVKRKTKILSIFSSGRF
jgi:hypothetical protein